MNKCNPSAPVPGSYNNGNNSQYVTPMGRGAELKYEYYYPQNDCMVVDPNTQCRKIYYPFEHIKTMCTAKCLRSVPGPNINSVVPAELYGNALQMDGGDGTYYFQDLRLWADGLTKMTYSANEQPYHFSYVPGQ